MPQSPLNLNTKGPGGAYTWTLADAAGLFMTSRGGLLSKLNMTAANVIKAAPGRVSKLIVIAPGSTSGGWTLNDCASVGAAAASNQIWLQAYNGAANVEGEVIDLDWPCAVGIVLSTVPGAGSPILAISYT